MKKRIILFSLMMSFMMFFGIHYAAEMPTYDASYNNGTGALYANGTPITIAVNANGETVVSWTGGQQVVPATVAIFGGGTAGTSYNSSNIRMNSGTISYLYGGGMSLEEASSSDVATSYIEINGGTVLESVYGGGMIYSQVATSNVIIKDGTVSAVAGGGAAFATISGQNYSAGTEEDAIHSKNRVEMANVTIDSGTINSESAGYGLVYGGGQGYSYTGKANLVINNGDMSKAYVTAGGSNGYTANPNVTIDGGNISLYQSVNRGEVNAVKTEVNGGAIQAFYIGGESGDATVTGKINAAEVDILGGKVRNLSAGTSEGAPIVITEPNFDVVYVKNTVINKTFTEGEKEIDYEIAIPEQDITLSPEETTRLTTTLTTNPVGYESLFQSKEVEWTSSNPEVATVDANGNVTAIAEGESIITAQILEKEAQTVVNVLPDNTDLVAYILLILILFLMVVLLSV